MSRDRPHAPQTDKPITASVQAAFQQNPVPYQITAPGSASAPKTGDAEANFQRGSELKRQHRYEEALASFDQAIALRPDYAEAHNNRGILLANLERLDDALAGFDRAIVLKADYAEAYNNRALVLQDLKRLDDALESIDKAIALKPDNAWAHNNRGVALQDLGRIAEALASFDHAIALKPDYAEAYYNRAMALQDLNRLDDALAGFGKALALKPDYAGAYNNRGVVLQDLGRPAEALASFDKATVLMPDYAEAYHNQSHCLLKMGRFEQGWRLHEWRKRLPEPIGNRSFAQPLWTGSETVTNKTVFVHWEQGFGDTIQFCRYAKLLRAKGAKVVMSVQEPLRRLLNTIDPEIQIVPQHAVPDTFDYHCPMMSLPYAFRTTLESIPSQAPYLFADEVLREAWDSRLPKKTKPRIGVVWSGNSRHKYDHNRSIRLEAFAPLFTGDAQWICLQKEISPADTALLHDNPHVVRIGDALEDFTDTAAVIDLMDLIVTVDTSVAHLAGAMAKPVWLLLAQNADWRWLMERQDSPWYPTARLFRQDSTRSWQDVIARVRTALYDFARSGLR